MRKMKKINGYLVVKFNARELREYEGTALGEYGVIDAELYTGNLDVDRGAMEYDNAGSMEEAVELARGLESELDAEEPEVKVTIVKETDETTEEEEVDAQQMIAGWENVLRGQVASAHYKDVDERTAAHELYGYKVALRDLGLLDREDCYVLPDTFGEAPGPLPKKPEELLAYVCDELCRHRRPEMSQEELDAVCEKCSLERLANEADGRDLRAREKALGALYGLVDRIRDRESSVEADRVGAEARAYLRALATVQVITERERESFAAAIEDAVKARTAPAERTTFEHLHPDLKRHRETAKIYALGLALAEKCPPNDCRVYLNIFNAARELDAALDSLDADGAGLAEGTPGTGRRAGGDDGRQLRRRTVPEGRRGEMRAELKRAADLVAFQRREALSRKRLSGDPRNPFRPRYGAELTFAAASQEAETLGYILKLLEKEAARECARRVFPTLDAILDFVVGLGLMALGGLGLAAACVVAGAPDSFTRAAALLGLGFMAAVNLHRQKRK